ncbi:MAG: nickel pincer cofactor biosynthesis protein LarC [Limisphaerales bacterium]
MKTLYLDTFSGMSGDMFVGAMLDLGVGLDALTAELRKLSLSGYHLHASRVKRQEIDGVKFDVHLESDHEHDHEDDRHHEHEHGHDHHQHGHEHHGHEHKHEHGRTYQDIATLIAASGLSEWVKTKSIAVFYRLAVAEGKIHGRPAAEVHFHEVGAVDSMVDIVGGCAALEILGKPRVLAGPAIDGTGWIDCAHGRFPIPAPATLEVLAARGVPISQCEEPHELITPTGAALLAELAESFGPMQGLVPSRIGCGVGGRENHTRPNILRAILGETSAAAAHDWEIDTVAVLETNIDDSTPEVLGNFIDKAMAAGALDVSYTPVQMKKNRPGARLSVLCAPAEADRFSEMILRQTSAFGLRRWLTERRKLRREFQEARTPYGVVTVKIGWLDGKVVQRAPEYESCRKRAEEHNAPLQAVYEAALAATAPAAQLV